MWCWWSTGELGSVVWLLRPNSTRGLSTLHWLSSPVFLNSGIATLELTFWSHITLAVIPGLLELFVDGQPTNLLVGYLLCVSLCVMMLFMFPTAISISMHVAAVILTRLFTGG